jgi:ABC-type multidrug transport system fused ATPase/permease subunit
VKFPSRIYEDNKKVAVKRASVGFLLNLISTGGYYGAYAVVLIRTLAGAISVGTFTFLTGAFSRSRMYIEKILQSFTDISDQALYLKDLFEFFEMQPAIRSLPARCRHPGPFATASSSATWASPIRALAHGRREHQFSPGSRRKNCAYRREWSRQDHPGQTPCPAL